MKDIDRPNGDLPLDQEEKKSKTRRKKEMIELQKLGERLVGLPNSFLRKIDLPPGLLEAVLSAKEIRAHGARRRQMQRIGVLMREVETGIVEKAFDDFRQGQQ
jgi:ribosome-associated protein